MTVYEVAQVDQNGMRLEDQGKYFWFCYKRDAEEHLQLQTTGWMICGYDISDAEYALFKAKYDDERNRRDGATAPTFTYMKKFKSLTPNNLVGR